MTREYSSISVETTLNSGINTTATTMVLPSIAAATALLGGVTLAPGNVDIFTVAIDYDTVNEEIVYVTGVSGDTLTISRGQAGTGTAGVSGIAHNAGASIKHVLTSEDLIYFNTAVQPSTLTAKGDIYAASAAGAVGRVAVGTNGQVLTADSSQTRGLAWTTVSSTPRIGQVVQATTSTYTGTSSTSYVDATGMTASITPTSNTSKVLVTMSFVAGVDGNPVTVGAGGQCQIVRGSTSILDGIGDLAWYITGPSNYSSALLTSHISFSYLDSPATTSATTYKLQIQKYLGALSYGVNNGSTGLVTLQEVLV
jgi:DNA-binding transcriptional regulator YdaS (Cro superfamily)